MSSRRITYFLTLVIFLSLIFGCSGSYEKKQSYIDKTLSIDGVRLDMSKDDVIKRRGEPKETEVDSQTQNMIWKYDNEFTITFDNKGVLTLGGGKELIFRGNKITANNSVSEVCRFLDVSESSLPGGGEVYITPVKTKDGNTLVLGVIDGRVSDFNLMSERIDQ